VRPYTDSYINPNPLMLVHENFRNFAAGQVVCVRPRGGFSERALAAPPHTFAPAELTAEAGAFVGCERGVDDTGRVRGKVMLRKEPRDPSKDEPANQARVIADGGYERPERRTDSKGRFELTLPAGEWTIYVQAIEAGYIQEKPETIRVVKGKEAPEVTIILLPDKPPSSRPRLTAAKFRRDFAILAQSHP